jgi:uncharacterized protein YceH (UPF0502 family)
VSWSREFDDPIPLPRGRRLVTLQDAGNFITKLSKAEHDAAEWQAPMEAMFVVATLGGPTMFARIGVMQALNRNAAPEVARILRYPGWRHLTCAKSDHLGARAMKSQHHFEIQCEIEPREAAQIRTLIADLDRIVQVLTCDIATEEERTRVFDRSDAMYAILARTLAARRDNLRGTIAALEQRLATIKAPLFEPVAA